LKQQAAIIFSLQTTALAQALSGATRRVLSGLFLGVVAGLQSGRDDQGRTPKPKAEQERLLREYLTIKLGRVPTWR